MRRARSVRWAQVGVRRVRAREPRPDGHTDAVSGRPGANRFRKSMTRLLPWAALIVAAHFGLTHC